MEKAEMEKFWEKRLEKKSEIQRNVFDNDGNLLLKRSWTAPGKINIFRR